MRKAATNANMLQLSFKQANVEFVDRKQVSMLLDLAGRSPNRNSDNMSPVIITSLDKSARKAAKSIVFDVRSETPESLHRGTPKKGGGAGGEMTDKRTTNNNNLDDG